MQLPHKLRLIAKNLTPLIKGKLFPVRWKELNELKYWEERKKAEGQLSNRHFEHFYTKHFGLDASYYNGKVVLDIGCGPRGSLEWASMASRRIGLDPLAQEYLRLGAAQHQMEYVADPSEQIPLQDAECDAVFSFNSLDHVKDVDRTIEEIKRVVRPGGLFLLLVEVNHSPTACEPHKIIPEKLLDSLRPEFKCESLDVYKPVVRGMYQSIRADKKLQCPEQTKEIGYLSAKFIRIAPGHGVAK